MGGFLEARFEAWWRIRGRSGGSMRLEFPEFGHQTETLAAVVLGALLATVSGVIANQWEAAQRRHERERSAALLLGEVLSTLKVLLEAANRARLQPPAYGPVTRRMLRAARREIDIYERNRESLVDLRDPALRADLHRLAVQIVMPLDGVIDSLDIPTPEEDLARERGFAFMMDNCDRIPAIVARLGRLARHDFQHFAPTPP
jgi:hypothetical protein